VDKRALFAHPHEVLYQLNIKLLGRFATSEWVVAGVQF
jgi:hypothetical protein